MQQDQLVAAAVSDRVVTVEVIVAVAAVVDVVAVAARARYTHLDAEKTGQN